MKVYFEKGTQLYIGQQIHSDSGLTYMPLPGQVLEKEFSCEEPKKDYQTTIAGTREIPVTPDTMIHYKDNLYLKFGDGNQLFTGLLPVPTIKNYTTKYKYYIITGIAIIAVISFIWYKHKH